MADLVHKRVAARKPALRDALAGRMTEHHRFVLEQLLAQADDAATPRVLGRHLPGQPRVGRQTPARANPQGQPLAQGRTDPGRVGPRDPKPYADLGKDYLDRVKTPEQQADQMVRKLQRLGYTVEIKRPAA